MSRLFAILAIVAVTCRAAVPDDDGPSQNLTLADARAWAIRNHPRIAAAQIQSLIAQEGVRAAQAGFFPTIQGYLTEVQTGNENTRILAGALSNSSVYEREAGGFSINQLITDFGHTSNLAAGSRFEARAEAQNASATREQILLGVDLAFFGELQAKAVLRVARETVADEQLLVDQVNALESNKLKSELDVSFADVGLEQARLVLQRAEGDEGAGQAVLTAAMGLHAPHRFDLIEVPSSSSPPGEMPALVSAALRDRPDILRLKFERDAAYRFARAENDLNNPTVSAVGVIGDSPNHDIHLPDHYSAAGVQLSLPIFTGGLYSARQRQAELRARMADENLRDAEDGVIRDVQVARLNLDTATQRLRTAEQLVKHADQALQLAKARYRLGSSSIVELSEAQLNATSAEITLAGGRYGVFIQRAILDYQIGIAKVD